MNKDQRKDLARMAIGVFTITFSAATGILIAGYFCLHLFKLLKLTFTFI